MESNHHVALQGVDGRMSPLRRFVAPSPTADRTRRFKGSVVRISHRFGDHSTTNPLHQLAILAFTIVCRRPPPSRRRPFTRTARAAAPPGRAVWSRRTASTLAANARLGDPRALSLRTRGSAIREHSRFERAARRSASTLASNAGPRALSRRTRVREHSRFERAARHVGR
jgi:hypothetical protein